MGNVALFLFLLSIPTQLGKHFWPEWSLVNGVRVDYLSPILYLTDIFWMVWVVSKLRIKKLFTFENLLFLLFLVVNVIVAQNRWVAVYRWVRIGQWIVTIKLITNYKLNPQDFVKLKITNYLKWIVPVWVIVESMLGLAQVINGGSLQGIWYWLGERRFSFSSIGIAQMRLFGEGLIRAYGTFSHPNSLAGFLLVALWYLGKQKNRNWLYWVTFWSGSLGILVSGSRWVWLVAIALIIRYQISDIRKIRKKELIGKMLVMVGMVILGLGLITADYQLKDFLSGWDDESLSKRWQMVTETVGIIKSNPLLGIGAGNLVTKMSGLQPVHNIFLLAWGEIGILGIILIGLRYATPKCLKAIKRNWILIGLVVVTGLMDHYWLTLPQNSWLLAVILGII